MKINDKDKHKLPYLLRNYAAKNMHKSCVSKVEENKREKIYEGIVDSEMLGQYDDYKLDDVGISGISIREGYDE